MTDYAFADPEAAAKTYLEAKIAASSWAGATVDTTFPTTLTREHVQIAWDGTPSDDATREKTVLRVTVWAPKGQRTRAKDLASLVRSWLLDFASAEIWRTTRGTGRTPGIDPDTKLPFVTFTVGPETRAAAVS